MALVDGTDLESSLECPLCDNVKGITCDLWSDALGSSAAEKGTFRVILRDGEHRDLSCKCSCGNEWIEHVVGPEMKPVMHYRRKL